jgi:hypothetical protein
MIVRILIYSTLALILLGALQMLVLDRMFKDVSRLIAFKKVARWVMYGLTAVVFGSGIYLLINRVSFS